MNIVLRLQSLFSKRAAAQLAQQQAAKAHQQAEKAAQAARDAQHRAEESISEYRRINYNNAINFLADADYPVLTPDEWAAKRAAWTPEQYATTDPDLYGSLTPGGSMAGQPYSVVEAEVRRRIARLLGQRAS